MNESLTRLAQHTASAGHNWGKFLSKVRNKLIAGILVAIPIIVTVWVLKVAYGFITGISQPFLERAGVRAPFLGFFVTLLLLLGLGFMATNVLGRRILESFERFLLRLPLVAPVYASVKQVIDSMKSFNSSASFKRVVYVDHTGDGSKFIGFVTGQYFDRTLGQEMTSVIIPTAPNPMTGIVVVIPSTKVINSELSLEEATKLIISAGLVAPKPRTQVEPIETVP
jgi:uncharacterized membrane protein